MGKGFQNFMSKKDFHPSAWWNLKKVWEAKEVEKQKKNREEELRVQYEKEQEILNNKALLGDEKAKMGLSFMYDAPAGMAKKEEPKEEPKFEWQRKYQAPREEWAKNNELIQDQPFGIQVRNVRCCKCHKWGHLNTDSECPLFGMSGNFEDPGYKNNPSDLIKDFRKEKLKAGPSSSKKDDRRDDDDEEWVDKAALAEEMKEEHGMQLKNSIMGGINIDQQLAAMNKSIVKKEPVTELDQMREFLSGMSDKQKKKLMKKLDGSAKSKKDKKKTKKGKKVKREIKEEPSDSDESDSDERSSSYKKNGVSSKVKRETVSEDESPRRKRNRSPEKRRRHDSSDNDEPRRKERDRRRSPERRDKTKNGTETRVKQEPVSDEERDKAKGEKHWSRRDSKRSPRNRSPERKRKEERQKQDFDLSKVKDEPLSDDEVGPAQSPPSGRKRVSSDSAGAPSPDRREHRRRSPSPDRRHRSPSADRSRRRRSPSEDRKHRRRSPSEERSRRRRSPSEDKHRRRRSPSADRRRRSPSVDRSRRRRSRSEDRGRRRVDRRDHRRRSRSDSR